MVVERGSCILHREFECFRAECPGGEPELQRLLNAAIEGVVVGYITPWRAQIADYIAR